MIFQTVITFKNTLRIRRNSYFKDSLIAKMAIPRGFNPNQAASENNCPCPANFLPVLSLIDLADVPLIKNAQDDAVPPRQKSVPWHRHRVQ